MEKKYYKEVFSKNLNYYLKEKGYSQSDLLKVINVSKSTMSTWCRGTRLPRMHHIQELADYLNIEKHMLIEDTSLKSKNISLIIENIKKILENNKNIILEEESLNKDSLNFLISYIQEGLMLISNNKF